MAAVAGNPSTSFAGPPPFSREAYILLANAASNKVTHLHKKAPKYQHYRYRQGQLSALARPRRTARNERIPPDGFDMATLEVTFHVGTPPPALLVPLVLSGPLCPAGISPPRGESPLSGEAYFYSPIFPLSCLQFSIKYGMIRLHFLCRVPMPKPVAAMPAYPLV